MLNASGKGGIPRDESLSGSGFNYFRRGGRCTCFIMQAQLGAATDTISITAITGKGMAWDIEKTYVSIDFQQTFKYDYYFSR